MPWQPGKPLDSPNIWLLYLPQTRRGDGGCGGEVGVLEKAMREESDATICGREYRTRKHQHVSLGNRARKVPLLLKPGGIPEQNNLPCLKCLKWFRLPRWLGDFTAPKQTHTSINTHTRTRSQFIHGHTFTEMQLVVMKTLQLGVKGVVHVTLNAPGCVMSISLKQMQDNYKVCVTFSMNNSSPQHQATVSDTLLICTTGHTSAVHGAEITLLQSVGHI